MMKAWQLIGEFNQFFKVSDRTISTSAPQISNERSTINRCEYLAIPSDTDGSTRIARDLGKLARRSRTQFPHHAARCPYSGIRDVSTRGSPQGKRLRIILKLETNLLHQPFRLIFNQLQIRLGKELKKGNLSINKCRAVCCSSARILALPSRSPPTRHFVLQMEGGKEKLKATSR
jgi:hypothetical protein